MTLFFHVKKQYFYIEKENSVFTFTLAYANMYVVKIGNYFRVFQKNPVLSG